MEENGGDTQFPAFPYKPYPIQIDFMNALYQSLEKGGVAILESPTGTGKTLSIICSALQWLVDKKKQKWDPNKVSELNLNFEHEGQEGSNDEPEWMRNFVVSKECELPQDIAKKKKNVVWPSKKLSSKKGGSGGVKDLSSHGELEEVEKLTREKADVSKVKDAGHAGTEEMNDQEFLVEDYESEEEDGVLLKKRISSKASADSSSEEEGIEDLLGEEEEEAGLKIYFCSRTHSQLSQFITELKKTIFSAEVKAICLGSRKNFCINDEVSRLGNPTWINERCLELQKNKRNGSSCKKTNLGSGRRARRTKASAGCPMRRSRKTERQFKHDISHQGPMDIEDLVNIGRNIGTCPYYGSRSMVPAADLVILPYQSILSKSSRESLGISLKNNIVIIDEAHNLADSLIHMNDSKITLSQLLQVHYHLERYFQRFRNLLGPGNRRYIQTLMVFTRAFIHSISNVKVVESIGTSSRNVEFKGPFESSLAINEFLFSLNIDNINLFKLLKYIEESHIIHKVSGYGEKVVRQENSVNGSADDGSTVSGFRALINMLSSLTNNDGDGRIIVSRSREASSGQQGGYLKYVMLTGEKIFSEILNQAHAIVLAGGTLQPIEEMKERLFPGLPAARMHFFSCGHIIPPENILPLAVSNGPSGQSFEFNYSSRSSTSTVGELGLLLCNLVTVVPHGIVVFFSSFDYVDKVYDQWKASGILGRIMKKKHIFREPRMNTEVDAVLKDYKETIESSSGCNPKYDPASCNGAVLLAVVGGKISEGINFSDGMGRCIVMVGLPYANPSDIELMERVKYIEGLDNRDTATSSITVATTENNAGEIHDGFDILRRCKHRGRQYYENLCMKAVNQSIGRAIRHINDYAAILLVDTRYTFDPSKRGTYQLTHKLPQWIRDHLVSAPRNYGEVHKMLRQFFKFHAESDDKKKQAFKHSVIQEC